MNSEATLRSERGVEMPAAQNLSTLRRWVCALLMVLACDVLEVHALGCQGDDVFHGAGLGLASPRGDAVGFADQGTRAFLFEQLREAGFEIPQFRFQCGEFLLSVQGGGRGIEGDAQPAGFEFHGLHGLGLTLPVQGPVVHCESPGCTGVARVSACATPLQTVDAEDSCTVKKTNFLIRGKVSPDAAKELALCYDRTRWPEAVRVAGRKGTVVLNVDDGRGADADEARRWDAFAVALRAAGGRTLGYVDMLDGRGTRKANSAITAEALAWLKQTHSGVWLDDARDTGADADVVRAIALAYPARLIVANPGTACTGALKRAPCILCESEHGGPVNYASDVVIAFVKDRAGADEVRRKAAVAGVQLVAVEPASTYHVGGVEYQKRNPLIP